MRIPRSAARATAAALAAGALSCGAAACGSTGTNGVATKSTGSIIKAAEDAVVGADSVRVQGDIPDGTQMIKLDMRLAKDKGASGTVTINGMTIELLRVGQEVYVKGDASFYQWVVASIGGAGPTPSPTPSGSAPSPGKGATPTKGASSKATTSKAASGKGTSKPSAAPSSVPGDITLNAMKDNYLHIGPSDPSYQTFALLTDARQLTDQALAGISGLSKDGQESVRGSRALVLSGAHQAKVLVGIDGPAYLLQVLPGDGGTINFLDFGVAVDIAAPSPDHVVDISKLSQ